MAEEQKTKRRQEREAKKVAQAAGRPGMKKLTKATPCAANGMVHCKSKYTEDTGTICDGDDCGVWFCSDSKCSAFYDTHVLTSHNGAPEEEDQ